MLNTRTTSSEPVLSWYSMDKEYSAGGTNCLRKPVRLCITPGLSVDYNSHLPPRGPHQPGRRNLLGALEMSLGDVFQHLSTVSHSVWGRVVPDIPDFCRELVAALAEE